MSKQMNVELDDELHSRLKIEAVNHRVTLGAVVSGAFEKFLALPLAQRRNILEKGKKVLGRKIST